MVIAVDVMGGDNGPAPMVEGAVLAVVEHGISVCLVGDEEVIQRLLPTLTREQRERIVIVHAPEVVKMHEPGAVAVRRPGCSVARAATLVREGKADAVVSMGNTGASTASGVVYMKLVKGIGRPAIGVPLPTTQGRPVLLVDAGATSDCEPCQLVQFAYMGSAYCAQLLGSPAPRVGLLSIGEEPSKGNGLVKATHERLRESSLNFVGNAEPGAMIRAEVDVAVCDGFTGNIVLKALEGFAELTNDSLRAAFQGSLRGRLAGLLGRPLIRRIRQEQHYSSWGGAVLLGVNGVFVVGHGKSNALAVCNAIKAARGAVVGGVVDQIREAAAKLCSEPVETTQRSQVEEASLSA